MLNADRKEDRYFPIESILFNLATYQNTYILSLFDCCREEMPASEKQTRAMGLMEEVTQSEQHNFVCLFGSAPGRGVPAQSTLAV